MIASLSESERQEALSNVLTDRRSKLIFERGWIGKARAEQLPPRDKNWVTWLLLAGRGFGKTRTGAETVLTEIKHGRAKHVALVGPTAADVRGVMVEGESGILSVATGDNKPKYQPSNRRLVWKNGATATCYSADKPQRLRGPQHDLAWLDEIAAWRNPQEALDMLMLGLRLGKRPRVIVTTTPKPIRLLRDMVADPLARVTRGSTYDNLDHLAPTFLSSIVRKYEGTRLGRQELHAELLEQADGALWTRAMIEAARIDPAAVPKMKRTVVAIDPAVTAKPGSDETGIIVAGLGPDGLAYVLDDASGRHSPFEWARRAVHLYRKHDADRIVAETNNGGDLVEATLRTMMANAPYKPVSAAKGKYTRAEPVAALYEQGKVRHAGGYPNLEDQMCNWEPGGAAPSPDRLDALVWALSELMLGEHTTGIIDFMGNHAGKVVAARPA